MEHKSFEWLPWHDPQRNHIEALIKKDRLAHAWLFHGPRGNGKAAFAFNLAGRFLCQQPAGHDACGVCHSCQLFLAGHHPDLKILEADEGKQIIGVDKIRNGVEFMHKTANQGGMRVALVPDADHMNINASNALLKTLEEPPANTIIILMTSRPGLLLATIRSRCQALLFPVPPRQVALDWLAEHHSEASAGLSLDLAGGAPLQALVYSDPDWLHLRDAALNALQQAVADNASVTGLSQSLNVESLHELLEILLLTVHQLQLLQVDAVNASAETSLKQLQAVLPANAATRLDAWHGKLLVMRRDLQRGLALNQKLAVETILLEWKKLMSADNPVANIKRAS